MPALHPCLAQPLALVGLGRCLLHHCWGAWQQAGPWHRSPLAGGEQLARPALPGPCSTVAGQGASVVPLRFVVVCGTLLPASDWVLQALEQHS